MKSKLKPEIRFSGFTGEWEQRKFGDNVEFYSGLTYSPDNITKKGTLVLRSSNVKNGEIVDADNVYVDPKVVNSRNVVIGDIIVVVRNGSRNLIGKHASVKKKMDNTVIGAFMTGIQSKIPSFTNALLDSNQFAIEINKNLGATINQITTGEFKKMQFSFPSNNEQIKIGNFFKQQDEMIALHQQELTTLKQTKQGFLQKMFPKEGESVPEVRFPGFNEKWEKCKLGEIVNITMGQSPNGENYTVNPNDHILVQGNADIKNGWVTPRVWTTQVTKTAIKGDIILSVRAPVGDVGKTQYDVVLGRGVAGIKGNEFIFQTLVKMKSNGFWTRYSTGSTFESINSIDLKEAIISVPEGAEQTKIGNFFKQLDNTISLHQRELDALKETKKAFLQRMFV
ncbi:restriction endonuclease subunit S (plasmid) [Sutcliffiella horikoshii]|uniref:restriction endonuclease subunit S n=1 Tax=Sutcliffiella horikoshii TaxID=79883 RepID=UPI001CC0F0F3|nr:restriction endonuclease subunit S [Sutcliffiella horikoshii]UAL49804.1 restriction endonuclease subunit S [Sutcliffiella horikoshii]